MPEDLRRRGNDVLIRSVLIRLDLGLTYCHLCESRETGAVQRLKEFAQRTLDSAEDAISRIEADSGDKNAIREMTAMLRNEIEVINAANAG